MPAALLLALALNPAPAAAPTARAEAATRAATLTPHAGFADNPLKGFVPYQADDTGKNGAPTFPHSLEFQYVKAADLMSGPETFTFDAGLEPVLEDVASRGRRLVLRVYLDYPDTRGTGVPQYLIDAGLEMRPYKEFGGGRSPDYEDERLVAALEALIANLGERYDGDPRLGVVQLGLLGHWGEWHTYPHEDWFASEAVRRRVLAAYTQAFPKTPLVARYPDAVTLDYPVGLHDDSFAFATLPTDDPDDDWFFLTQLQAAGGGDVWKTRSIGGEVRPEVQKALFDPNRNAKGMQDYAACVECAHASWLINQYVFNRKVPDEVRAAAVAGAKALGYRFAATAARIERSGDDVTVKLTFANRGVVPFPHDWPARVGLFAADGTELAGAAADWDLSSILPNDPVTKTATFTLPAGFGSKSGTVGVTIPDPLPAAPPLRFANERTDEQGVLRLGPLP